MSEEREERVVSAEYCDFKIIRSRSVCQLVFEIPIENGEDFTKKFGMPIQSESKHVAIALLNRTRPPQQQIEDHNSDTSAHKYVQMAAILCKDEVFREYLNDMNDFEFPLLNEGDVANHLRVTLNIKSRSELKDNPDARAELTYIKNDYDDWKNKHGKV